MNGEALVALANHDLASSLLHPGSGVRQGLFVFGGMRVRRTPAKVTGS